MAEPPVFGQADFNNLELVRQIVFHRLRTDSDWNHFDYSWDRTDRFVRFGDNQIQSRFVVLANEVLWQLVIQGVITPGMDSSNPSLPWFRITDHGQKVLKHERFLPHDPTNYLGDLQAAAKTTLGTVTIAYVEEALRCFTSGCHMASVLLLGVAAESVFLKLCDVVKLSLKNSKEQTTFEKLSNVRQRHRWIVDKYLSLPGEVRRKQLPESLDITLTSLYELIRRQRNELGHPQESPPALIENRHLSFFALFRAMFEMSKSLQNTATRTAYESYDIWRICIGFNHGASRRKSDNAPVYLLPGPARRKTPDQTPPPGGCPTTHSPACAIASPRHSPS